MTDYLEASALEGNRKVENYNHMKNCGHSVLANLKKAADENKDLMEALARITKLEKRLAELEARPYYPVLQPLMPSPLNPTSPMYPWIITTGTGLDSHLPDSIKPKVY